MSETYSIQAIWDPEAKVYYSETNVRGLVVEAESIAEFVAIAEELLPEILRQNLYSNGSRSSESGVSSSGSSGLPSASA